jgi:hypothetical protein
MKLKHLAFILSAVTFSQATLAAAPLCRSVLRSFTQEQIDAAIEDFTRLTLQADNAQADGDKSTMTRSLLTSKRLKEKELIENLNISREELRKLVSTRSAIQQKRIEESAEAKSKGREREAEAIRGMTYALEKHMDTDQTYPQATIEPVANATRLLIKSSPNQWLASLKDGTPILLKGFPDGILPDAIFTGGFTNGQNWELTVTNFHTSAQTKIIFQPSNKIVSNDKQSMIFTKSFANTPLEYLQLDINGKILHQGTLPDFLGAEVRYAGQKDWLLRKYEGYTLFNPQTKTLKPLGIAGSSIVKDLHHGRVAIKEGKTLHILDTNSDQWTSKEIPTDFEFSFSSNKFIWLKFKDSLRSFDINTLDEVPDSAMAFGSTYTVQSFEKSNFVSISWLTAAGNKIHKGIYRNDDLFNPIFDTAEVYSDKNISIKEQTLSEDGKSLIIVGTNRSSGEEKYFVDVYRLGK